MKSPLGKLRGFGLRRKDRKEEDQRKPAKPDELAEATRDMQDLRSCYDSILSAAATIANNAYELSIAFEELGSCLLDRIALNDNEDSGRTLMMIGKAQFDLQRHLDVYRAHIFQTMAKPSKSLLRQLEIVEDMKCQCDEKREFYKNMLLEHKEKRSRLVKGGNISSKELQRAQTDFEEAAALFVFRLKSLKQGRFRSLLTQAARHHAAQLSFFRKGLKTLEGVDSHVKLVAEQQHIDYQFSDLEDEDDDDGFSSYDRDNDYNDNYASDDREVTSAYKQNYQDQDAMPKVSVEEYANRRDFRSNERRLNYESQSAPIFVDKKVDRYNERIKEARLSYVLPMPADHRNPASTSPVTDAFPEKKGEQPKQFSHSSPLEVKEPIKLYKEYTLPHLERPSEQLSAPQTKSYSVSKSFKRQAFSGPLMSSTTSFQSRPKFNEADYGSKPQSFVLPSAVPSTTSPPKSSVRISELHELPRPPTDSETMMKPSSLNGYSGPLVSKRRVLLATMGVSYKTSPLPTPPAPVTRSFSIPSNCSQRSPEFAFVIMEDSSTDLDPVNEVAFPRLVPISLTSYSSSFCKF